MLKGKKMILKHFYQEMKMQDDGQPEVSNSIRRCMTNCCLYRKWQKAQPDWIKWVSSSSNWTPQDGAPAFNFSFVAHLSAVITEVNTHANINMLVSAWWGEAGHWGDETSYLLPWKKKNQYHPVSLVNGLLASQQWSCFLSYSDLNIFFNIVD